MSRKSQSVTRCALFLLTTLTVLGLALIPRSSRADQTGTLKLRVHRCLSVQWIGGARVDVIVTRLNVGQIDSATGYADKDGNVDFTFTNLEGQDEATVTVTPSGEASDNNHHYYWNAGADRNAGWWDLGSQDSICSDNWYDQTHNIIACEYHSN